MPLVTCSLTMGAVCAVRAEHGASLDDAYAARIVELIPEAKRHRAALDEGSRGMFSRSILVRSRWFSEAMRRARGYQQLLVLGAGLDLRPLTMTEWRDRAVFSVDHPQSQALCRELLATAGIDAAPLRFVAADLAREAPAMLMQRLIAAGFDPTLATVVVWEGSTYYIDVEAVFGVLERLVKDIPTVRFIGDFLNRDGYFKNGQVVNAGVARNLEFLTSIGEAWIGFFEPALVAERLTRIGYRSVDVIDRTNVEQHLMGEIHMQPSTMFFVDARSRGQS